MLLFNVYVNSVVCIMSKKGPEFERKTCRDLSLWVSNGEFDDAFWRTASSGARGTVRSKSGKQTANAHGDIMYTRPEGAQFLNLVTCELKKGYSTAVVEGLFNGPVKAKSNEKSKSKKQTLLAFFQQTIESAQNAGTPHWLLIFKKDNRDTMCYMDESLFLSIVSSWNLIGSPPFRTIALNIPVFKEDELVSIVGMRFNDFLQIPYEVVVY